MRSLFLLAIKYHAFLVFLVLEIISLVLIFNYNSFQRASFLQATEQIVGSVHETSGEVTKFFTLGSVNKQLNAENARLKDSIQELQEQLNIGIDSITKIAIAEPVTYGLIPAKVVQSTYQNRNNLFTLNKGSNDMVTPFSGVISSKGIVGVIKHTSKNYASGLSILHSEQSASVVIDSLKEVGFLQWDFKDHTLAKLEFIPRHVKAKVGQTVSVSHLSYVFPEGTPVGEIVNVQKNEGSAHLDITVKLYEDLRNLKHVYVVKNLGDEEKKELEEKTN